VGLVAFRQVSSARGSAVWTSALSQEAFNHKVVAPPTKWAAPRSGDLSIVCNGAATTGRVAATCMSNSIH